MVWKQFIRTLGSILLDVLLLPIAIFIFVFIIIPKVIIDNIKDSIDTIKEKRRNKQE